MPSLSIDHPNSHHPGGTSSPNRHHHRLNRARRPHFLRIQSPPKSVSPLILFHHNDPSKLLLTPEIVHSQQNQASPWKGINPPPQTAQPSTTEKYFSSSQRTDSLLSVPKISLDSYHSNSGSGTTGSLHLSNSQQNFLQRLHYEKQQQQQSQLHHQSLPSKNSKLSRNVDFFTTNSTKFQSFPEEISLMRMDEGFGPFNPEVSLNVKSTIFQCILSSPLPRNFFQNSNVKLLLHAADFVLSQNIPR